MILEMSEEERDDIISESHKDFELVNKIFIEHGRWDINFKLIFKRKSTGKYYSIINVIPATEMQDIDECNFGELIEVEPKEEIHTIYIKVDN